ncbi:hypothetical protein [Halobacteriovorax sp. Y22]|nr:hypothetical protein [Halobacteriovorax sp. Y22]TGD49301.1 hypothetical protein EP118_00420 [Halobacteriovorax sp. Y22]
MPIILSGTLIIYLARDLVIILLFSEKFLPARDYFLIQLSGDIIKVYSWLYAYPMLSKGAARWFISTEITYSLLFVILSKILINYWGLHGINTAYLINYSLYFITVRIILKKYAK